MVAEAVRAIPPKVAARRLTSVTEGDFSPRVAPPRPARSDIEQLRKAAKVCGIKLRPWQDLAGEYMTALRGKQWLYPEIALLVARQNGKTAILVPRIVMGLVRGERIMHTAQDRALPRDVFVEVADVMENKFPGMLKSKPRLANGTERISMINGGLYRIVSPNRNGARGPSNDLVIIDEAREMTDYDYVAAAQPTLTVSKSPQIIYLSNAGTDESVVLNDLTARAKVDDQLGYLEWSADPGRDIADKDGWQQANPSLIGGENAKAHWAFLQRMYDQYVPNGRGSIFETEHLCRQVRSERPALVPVAAWDSGHGALPSPVRPVMGLGADPEGRRVSAAVAWASEGLVYLHLLTDVDGYPVDLAAVAEQTIRAARAIRVREVVFDPWADRDFARYFKDMPAIKKIDGADWEAACERFVRTVESGRIRHDDDGTILRDIMNTVRRETTHGWVAVRSSDEIAVTASLAAIRAVWLATKPNPGPPRVY